MRDELDQLWDAIVVGTGMGGATLGLALARAGQRVLFLEKGASHLSSEDALLGSYAETAFPKPSAPQPEHRDSLQRAGRYAEVVEDRSKPRTTRFIPFIGAGTGGSTALYGMALERFFPSDFQPGAHHRAAPQTTLPERWPVGYEEMAPYYAAAEHLFRVRGTRDPLRAGVDGDSGTPMMAPPPLTPGAAELVDFFGAKGLHPYRLPLACEFVEGCATCQGYLCEKNCKNDASRICLAPAIAEHGARLLDRCEVLRVEASRRSASGVVCRWRGEQRVLRARRIILAAGALETPRILLASASADWPDGLANDSRMVGRNLMRHHIDLYLVTPKLKGFDNRHKEFAFNDFYDDRGEKLGSVQSFGRLPPVPVLAASMADDLRQGPLPWTAPLFRMAQPLMKPVLKGLVHDRMILATTLEDLPYAENRVALPCAGSGAHLELEYRVRPHDARRIEAFRTRMKAVLKPYSFSIVKQADNNQRIAHVCGTCRFGSDPADSVLDANCRAHGLDNLYVVDASFFPSSGGTNPSLTVAANALRVAAHLIQAG